MKFVCKTPCYINLDGMNRRYNPGQVVEAEKCPTHFKPVSDAVDFLTASAEELIAAKWSRADAVKAVKDAFGVDITAKKKDTIVAQIIDARERSTGDPDAKPDKAK